MSRKLSVEERMLEKLNVLIKLTSANVVQNKDFREQVRLLSYVGLQPKEIAELLGKTSNNVRVTLSLLKKDKTKKDENEGDTDGEKTN